MASPTDPGGPHATSPDEPQADAAMAQFPKAHGHEGVRKSVRDLMKNFNASSEEPHADAAEAIAKIETEASHQAAPGDAEPKAADAESKAKAEDKDNGNEGAMGGVEPKATDAESKAKAEDKESRNGGATGGAEPKATVAESKAMVEDKDNRNGGATGGTKPNATAAQSKAKAEGKDNGNGEAPTASVPPRFLQGTPTWRKEAFDDASFAEELNADQRAQQELALSAVRADGHALKNLEARWRTSWKVVFAAVQQNGAAFIHADPSIRKDRGMALRAVFEGPAALACADSALQMDRTFVAHACVLRGSALAFAKQHIRADRAFLLEVVQENEEFLRYVDAPLTRNEDFMHKAVARNAAALKFLHIALVRDEEFLLTAVRLNARAMLYVAPEVLRQRAFLVKAVRASGEAVAHVDPTSAGMTHAELVARGVDENARVLQFADDALRGDAQFVFDCVLQNPESFCYAAASLHESREFAQRACEEEPRVVLYLPPGLQTDAEFVLAAVEARAEALRYAHLDLYDNRAFVLRCVKKNEVALTHCAASMRSLDFIFEALGENAKVLEHADDTVRMNFIFCLRCVEANPETMLYVHPYLAASVEFVKTALGRRGAALKYCSVGFQRNDDCVLTAMKDDGLYLEYAHDDLKKSVGFMLRALQIFPDALMFAGENLRQSREFIFAACAVSCSALHFAAPELRTDRALVSEAVRDYGAFAFKFAAEELKADEDFVLEMIRQHGDVICVTDYKRFRGNPEFLHRAVAVSRDTVSYTPSGFWQERAFRMLYQQDWIDVATGWSTRGATRAELCMLRWIFSAFVRGIRKPDPEAILDEEQVSAYYTDEHKRKVEYRLEAPTNHSRALVTLGTEGLHRPAGGAPQKGERVLCKYIDENFYWRVTKIVFNERSRELLDQKNDGGRVPESFAVAQLGFLSRIAKAASVPFITRRPKKRGAAPTVHARELAFIAKRINDLESRCGYAALDPHVSERDSSLKDVIKQRMLAEEAIEEGDTPEKLKRPRFRRTFFRASAKEFSVMVGAQETPVAKQARASVKTEVR